MSIDLKKNPTIFDSFRTVRSANWNIGIFCYTFYSLLSHYTQNYDSDYIVVTFNYSHIDIIEFYLLIL